MTRREGDFFTTEFQIELVFLALVQTLDFLVAFTTSVLHTQFP